MSVTTPKFTSSFHNTNDVNNETGGGMRPDIKQYSEYQISIAIWQYLSPVILVVGTIGSVLSLLVLRRKSLRTQTTMFYLSVLAVADLMVLYVGMVRLWLENAQNVYIRLTSAAACKFHTFLVYLSLDLSVWVLVAVSIDRCLYVTWPVNAKKWCTLPNARAVVCAIFCFSVLINTHFFWTYNLEFYEGQQVYANGNKKCYADTTSELTVSFVENVWPWIDFCVYCLFPFIFMATSNVIIIKQLIRTEKTLASYQRSVENKTQQQSSQTDQAKYTGSSSVRISFPSSSQTSRGRENLTSRTENKQGEKLQESDSFEFNVPSSSLFLTPKDSNYNYATDCRQKTVVHTVFANKGFTSEALKADQGLGSLCTVFPNHNLTIHLTKDVNSKFIPLSGLPTVDRLEQTRRSSSETNSGEIPEHFHRSKTTTMLTDAEMHELPVSPMSITVCEESSLLGDKQRFIFESEDKEETSSSNTTPIQTGLFLLDEALDVINTANCVDNVPLQHNDNRNFAEQPQNGDSERRTIIHKVHSAFQKCHELRVDRLSASCLETGAAMEVSTMEVNTLKASKGEKDLLVRKVKSGKGSTQITSHATRELSVIETTVEEGGMSLTSSCRHCIEVNNILKCFQKNTASSMKNSESLHPIRNVTNGDIESVARCPDSVACKSEATCRSNRLLNSEPSDAQMAASSRRSTSSVSKTLLAVTIMFWILNAPIVIFVICHTYFVTSTGGRSQATIALVWTIVNILQYMNNAMHFFLYCLTAPKFRQELKEMFNDGIKILKG